MKLVVALTVSLLATGACTSTAVPTAALPPTAVPASVDPAAEDARLLAFLDDAFEAQMARSPEGLTSLGRKTQNDKLDDYTDSYREAGLALEQRQLAEMEARFDPAKLSPSGRVSYLLFKADVERSTANNRWRWHRFPASTNGSPAGSLPVFLINEHDIDSVSDAEAYIARLKDIERVMGEISANMRHQASLGIVPSTFNFAPVRADAKRVLAGAPFSAGKDTPLFADFKEKVGELNIAQSEKDRLIAGAQAALTGPVRRGYDTFLATWDGLEKQAKGNRGAWSLPDGGAYYANRLANSTTTDMTAEQIHQVGLARVTQIHAEMTRIQGQLGFKGTLPEFFAYLKSDAKFKYANTEAGRQQYLADAKRYVAGVMERAPQYFRRLPKAPLEVRAVEKWRQDTASVAFYNSPSEDGSRPGIFYVNLADMNQVLKPQIEAITYHEAAPGHHFQIALQQELTDLPKFRKFGGYGAYTEGWGLYAEGLGKEMGFYTDPISEFGMLSTQLWRAIRMVVDTGIHEKRWTREQAIQYFLANGLLSERDATKEVERYFNNPGQATSYMVGQMKILALRDKARAALGDKFDVRDFHAAVLENGSVPLDVLEQLVDRYIAEKRG